METFYLTKRGLQKIKKEYGKLQKRLKNKIKEERPGVFQPDELNPEYQSFQEELDRYRARLAELKYIIAHATLIKIPPQEEQNKVYLGATVLVENKGKVCKFKIVESLESNPALGKISNESPVGRALLGKKVGNVVTVSTSSKATYKIREIEYSRL